MKGIVETAYGHPTKLAAFTAPCEARRQKTRGYQTRRSTGRELARQSIVEPVDSTMPAAPGFRQCLE